MSLCEVHVLYHIPQLLIRCWYTYFQCLDFKGGGKLCHATCETIVLPKGIKPSLSHLAVARPIRMQAVGALANGVNYCAAREPYAIRTDFCGNGYLPQTFLPALGYVHNIH